MLQDIYPKIFKPEYINKQAEPDSYLLFYNASSVFLKKTKKGCDRDKEADTGFLIPTFRYFKEYCSKLIKHSYYLFSIDSEDYYLVLDCTLPEKKTILEEKIDIFRKLMPKSNAFAVLVGYHIYTWLQSRKYCGSCGTRNIVSDTERALKCPSCFKVEYPRISPAVIVAITDKNRILLTKRANSDYKLPALVSGFLEVGETLEDNVKREVLEEVGINIKNIKYYGSQPWGIAEVIMIAFTAELDGSDKLTVAVEELSEAAWFEREEVPVFNAQVSIGQELIREFREGRL